MRLGFSHLGEHKFRHNFPDTLSPLWSYSLEPENRAHFSLHCRNYTNIFITLMNQLGGIDNAITSREPNELLQIILSDDWKFKDNIKKRILIATIQFIKISNRFNQSLI